jgi:hypothetical protein
MYTNVKGHIRKTKNGVTYVRKHVRSFYDLNRREDDLRALPLEELNKIRSKLETVDSTPYTKDETIHSIIDNEVKQGVIVLPELIPEKGFRIMGEEKKKNKDRGGEGLLSRRRHLTKFIKDLESEQGYNPELIKKYKQQLEEVEKELDI